MDVDTSTFADGTIFNLIMRTELIDYPRVPPSDQEFKLKILPPLNTFTPPEPKPKKKEEVKPVIEEPEIILPPTPPPEQEGKVLSEEDLLANTLRENVSEI